MSAGPTATRPTAIVTGASRGIGKACAIALATAGFDVAITARTVRREDRTFEGSGRVAEPLPGSLEETAEAIEAAGATAHLIPLDLMDRDRLVPAAREAIGALGHVDVLLNNAIYSGPGNYGRFLDADPDAMADRIFGNVTAQMLFMQPVVESMVGRGGGTLLFMTSAAAYAPPFAMPGEGGWGFSYAVSKGGFHRMAVQLAYEYAAEGLRAYNVQPGFVATERVRMVGGPVANIAATGVEPAVIGGAVAHLVTNPAEFDSGSTIQLQDLARSIGLLPARQDRI